jgi:hypothetical protein
VIEQKFSGLDGERITFGISTSGAVEITVTNGDDRASAWMRGRDAFRLAEFLLHELDEFDREREEAPT